MKYFYTFSILILLAYCNKPDMQPPKVNIVANSDFIYNNDTLTIPTEAKVEFYACTDNKSYSYLWDFGDNSSSNKTSVFHSYSSKGLYSIKLKVRDGAKENDYNFVVSVIGQVVGNKDVFRKGLSVFEYNSDVYIFAEGSQECGLYLSKVNDKTEIYNTQLYDLSSYLDLVDIKMDYENNFII